jgi:DNA-binding helix-turn-helix protein
MNRLREIRLEEGLTQECLAQKLGVAKLTISKWERGIHQIRLDKAEMLSSIFGVSIPYLLGIDDVSEQDLPVYKQYILELNNFLINLLRNADKLTAQNLSDIKREARNLYESLVGLQYEAERVKHGKRVKKPLNREPY